MSTLGTSEKIGDLSSYSSLDTVNIFVDFTSKQSFLCVMDPQFSHAPFLNFVAILVLSTPFLYQLSMELKFVCFSS